MKRDFIREDKNINGLSTSEFRTSDCSCNGHIERFGGFGTFGVIRNKQFMSNVLPRMTADAFTLITHDNDTICRQRLLIDILPLKESAIDRQLRTLATKAGQICRQIHVMDINASHSTHRSLHRFGIEGIDRTNRTNQMLDAKPIGNTYDCT